MGVTPPPKIGYEGGSLGDGGYVHQLALEFGCALYCDATNPGGLCGDIEEGQIYVTKAVVGLGGVELVGSW